jgi:hypothetical protein
MGRKSPSRSGQTGSATQPRRNDLDNAIAAIELALEYVGKLGDFDVSSLRIFAIGS